MGRRSKVVLPTTKRIHIVDVRRERLKTFIEKESAKAQKGSKAEQDAYRTQLAALESAVAVAEEDPEWIDIKERLNAGETRQQFTILVKDFHAGEAADLDPDLVGLTKALTYLVDWSYIDTSGDILPIAQTVPMAERVASINSLDPADYLDIIRAIEAHDKAIEEARSATKNDRPGEALSSPTSTSVAG